MSVPNQKKVSIAPRVIRNREHIYATFNVDALRIAMIDLETMAALKLWLYLNKNQDNYQLELSQKACAEWGIKKDSYYSAVKILIDKGYLVPIRKGSNIYRFYEKSADAHYPDAVAERERAASAEQKSAEQKAAADYQKMIAEMQNWESDEPKRNITNNTRYNTKNNTIGDYAPNSEKRETGKKTVEKKDTEIYNDLVFCQSYREQFKGVDFTALGKLLQDGQYYLNPEKRIAQMNDAERRKMREIYNQIFDNGKLTRDDIKTYYDMKQMIAKSFETGDFGY